MTKEEVYNEATLKNLGNNPTGTRMGVIYSAMDEYAKQLAMSFGQWLIKNEYRPFPKDNPTRWLQGGMSVSKSSEDLYLEFLSQPSITENASH